MCSFSRPDHIEDDECYDPKSGSLKVGVLSTEQFVVSPPIFVEIIK